VIRTHSATSSARSIWVIARPLRQSGCCHISWAGPSRPVARDAAISVQARVGRLRGDAGFSVPEGQATRSSRSTPRASASAFTVDRRGSILPFSMLHTVEVRTPDISASSVCVSPAALRHAVSGCMVPSSDAAISSAGRTGAPALSARACFCWWGDMPASRAASVRDNCGRAPAPKAFRH
jgi:hypothetical protein